MENNEIKILLSERREDIEGLLFDSKKYLVLFGNAKTRTD